MQAINFEQSDKIDGMLCIAGCRGVDSSGAITGRKTGGPAQV